MAPRLARWTYSRGSMTCGLLVPSDPTSDHLTPQETTNQQALDWGPDWADLSCPGSIVVASPSHEEEEA